MGETMTTGVDSERPGAGAPGGSEAFPDDGEASRDAFEVFRDDWGIPHLRAADARALARAQGYVTALDRAWQLETERHRLLGTSASCLGAEAVDWDRFVRRARLADTARRCFGRLAPETAAWVGAYVDGVNDGLAEGASRAPEFAAVGRAPAAGSRGPRSASGSPRTSCSRGSRPNSGAKRSPTGSARTG